MNVLDPVPAELSTRDIAWLRPRVVAHCAGMRASRFRSASLLWPQLALLGALGCVQGSAEDANANFVGGPSLEDAAPHAAGDESDRYDTVGTNPFVATAHDPLSTFASDVDTASYDIFVRDMSYGELPAPSRVRLEEYVNSFGYDYPAPPHDAEEPFAITLGAAPSPLATDTTLLRVGIAGKQPPPQPDRAANLVFLVDVSGSMNGPDRLPLVKQVLRQTLGLLEPDDRVSIVTYASDTRVRLAPAPVSDSSRIIAEIERLRAGGSTAGAGGLDLAYAQASDGFVPGGLNHVILCTDGDFNVGPSSTRELVDLIAEKRETGITLTALGFGIGNLNDDMLEAVSNAGNGFYGVIGSEGQAAEYVQGRMLSTLSLIAKDVKIQVEFNPARVEAYRLLGYGNRALADDAFRDDLVDAGEIGSGHQVTALYELVLPGGTVPDADGAPPMSNGPAYEGSAEVLESELVRVKLRYKPIGADTDAAALEIGASLAPEDVANDISEADADLAWASSVAAFAEILKGSPYARPSELDVLDAIFSAQASRDHEREAFYELFRKARGRL